MKKYLLTIILFLSVFTVVRAYQPFYTNGLIAYYTFDGQDMISNVQDKGSGANNGNLVNFTSTTTIAGKLGQALQFDGVNDSVLVSDNSSVSFGTGVYKNISFWFKPSDVTSFQRVMGKGDTGEWRFYINGSRQIELDVWDSGANLTAMNSTVTLVANTLYFVSASYNGSTLSISVNAGTPDTQAYSADIKDGTNDFYIGEAGGGANFSGLIDDVRFYNRALTTTEVQNLYKMGLTQIDNSGILAGSPFKAGLVGFWTMDGLDVASNIADRSGNGNTGRLTNQPATTTVAGRIGQALSFDGVDDYVRVTTNSGIPAYSTTTPYSVAFWMKATANNPYGESNSGTANPLFSFQCVSGHLGIYIRDNSLNYQLSGGSDYSTDANMCNGTWRHVVWTDTSGTAKMYVDGVLDKSFSYTPSSLALNSSCLACIEQGGSLVQTLNGSLDDFRIYNRLLSAGEARELYNQGMTINNSATFASSPLLGSLKAFYTFDGQDIIQNIKDMSGLGNTGKLAGQSATTTVAGKIGQALTCDGVDDDVALTQTSGLPIYSLSAGYSIAMWVKSSDVANTVLYGEGSPSTDALFKLSTGFGGRLEFLVRNNDGSQTNSGNSTTNLPFDGKWHHIVWTDTVGTVNFYMDGVPEALSLPQVTPMSMSRSTLCAMVTSSSFSFFPGTIDDVRLYAKALSQAEVNQLYKLPRAILNQ